MLIHVFSHLPPSGLAASASVSRRFGQLINSEHAWRAAFLRYYAGQDYNLRRASKLTSSATRLSIQIRPFTRLTADATWKSEYVVRTQLLRSIRRIRQRGLLAKRQNLRLNGQPAVLYDAELGTATTHMHAVFGSETDPRALRVAHASAYTGTMSQSNPLSGQIESSNCSEPLSTLTNFNLRFPGIEMYGLGASAIVGNPNVMDVSTIYGMVIGEGFPGGDVYRRCSFTRQHARVHCEDFSNLPRFGIPNMEPVLESICSIWIAKSEAVPMATADEVAIMTGSSAGIVSTFAVRSQYRLGPKSPRARLSARWALSPGVPIVSIAVDDDISPARLAQNRIWAVVVNALGEIFYLTKIPSMNSQYSIDSFNEHAWFTGRRVKWHLVEQSRRIAHDNAHPDVDGSYSPSSSWDGMCLSEDQLVAECHEIEQFFAKTPLDFRRDCRGWNMKRSIEVDFAGNDGNHAGENVVVFTSASDETGSSNAQRYTRRRVSQENSRQSKVSAVGAQRDSPGWSKLTDFCETDESSQQNVLIEEWVSTTLSLGGQKSVEFTSTAIDKSKHALTTVTEDPVFEAEEDQHIDESKASHFHQRFRTYADIPGQRARFVAAGTGTGDVFVWDMRKQLDGSADVSRKIQPARAIHTGSPLITSLALTALYIVHGGSDGLVQAWDPLASQTEPIRTIKSRANKVDRRDGQVLRQRTDLGRRFISVTAIELDPDPTVLRGVAACGFNVKYWNYNSPNGAGDGKKKRKSGRPSRRSNESFASTSKVEMNLFIAAEQREHEAEEASRRRENRRFAGRYGTDLGNDEEMLAYATMLSRESQPSTAASQDDLSEAGSSEFLGNYSGSNASGGGGGGALDDLSEANDSSVVELNSVDGLVFDREALDIRTSLLEEMQEREGRGTLSHAGAGAGAGADAGAGSTSTASSKAPSSHIGQTASISKASASASSPRKSRIRLASSDKEVGEKEVSGKEQADIDFAVQLSLAELRSSEEK